MISTNRSVLGFTVIEIVMALVIVGVLAVVAGPKFFSTTSYQQRVYYDEVLNSVRYARKLAVATNSHVQVNLTSTSIILQYRTEGSNCASGTTFTPVTDPTTRTSGYLKAAPGAVSMSFSANWPIYFNGLGQAIRASDCSVVTTGTITVVGANTVTVVGQTGFVQ